MPVTDKLKSLFRSGALTLAVAITFSGCASAATYASDNQVELYGRHRCSICQRFVADLQARRINHHFYDVDQDPDRAREMWALIHEHFPDSKSVGLPIVRVNGIVLIQPDFASFETYLNAAR